MFTRSQSTDSIAEAAFLELVTHEQLISINPLIIKLQTSSRITLGRATSAESDGHYKVCSKSCPQGISRRHCDFVRCADQSWVVTDQSLNGILVNATRIKEATLHHGDLITIGQGSDVVYRFNKETSIGKDAKSAGTTGTAKGINSVQHAQA